MKRVRYLAGVIGAVPALGGLALTANPAEAANHHFATGKVHDAASSSASPSVNCYGHQGNHTSHSGTVLRFYSAPEGSRTCIGTIEVSHRNASAMTAEVKNHYGSFCNGFGGGGDLKYACRKIFRRNGLEVSGGLIYGEGEADRAYSPYPFRHTGY